MEKITIEKEICTICGVAIVAKKEIKEAEYVEEGYKIKSVCAIIEEAILKLGGKLCRNM